VHEGGYSLSNAVNQPFNMCRSRFAGDNEASQEGRDGSPQGYGVWPQHSRL
jgi:hypothetical protein